jgi:hypothetical protein
LVILVLLLVVVIVILLTRKSRSPELLDQIARLVEKLDSDLVDIRRRLVALEVRAQARDARVEGADAEARPAAPRSGAHSAAAGTPAGADASVAQEAAAARVAAKPIAEPVPKVASPVRTVGGYAPQRTTTPPPSPSAGAPREPAADPADVPPALQPYERAAVPPKTTAAPPRPRVAAAPPRPSVGARLREQLAGEEWEAVVGASWLNKIGSLLLVTGIALFLGYSFTRLGPFGRVALGYALSFALLIGGVVLERRERYRFFARGLIGGGWAAVYYTTYAMHGLEAARVLDSAVVGSVALVVVAGGMIAHSLRYRSESLTGLTFVVGFFTLAISASSGFSLVASIPLVATLLVVAHRLGWSRMPVYGVIFAYATYLARIAFMPHVEVSPSAYLSGQAILSVYWLLFEGFDLAALRRQPARVDVSRAVYPLNATGFFGVSLLQWSPNAPFGLAVFFGAVAAAHVASALVRARLRRPSSFAGEAGTLERALLGGYEASITVAVAAGAIAIFLGTTGWRLPLALLIEGQALFVAGVSLREWYLRALGSVVLLAAAGVLGVRDVREMPQGGEIALNGVTIRPWTPSALLMAALFYLNRRLLRGTELVAAEPAFAFVASALIVLVLGFETPARYIGIAWLTFALVLFEIAVRRDAADFRRQAYIVGFLALVALLIVDVANAFKSPLPIWPPLAIAAVLNFGFARRVIRLPDDSPPGFDRQGLRLASSAGGTVALAALFWHVLPIEHVGVAWLVLALALFEIGLRYDLAEFRHEAFLLAVTALGVLAGVNAFALGTHATRPWLGLGAAALVVYAGAARIFALGDQRLPAAEARHVPALASGAATVLLTAFAWYALPSPAVTVAWALLGLVLIELGFSPRLAPLRFQGHVVLIIALGRAFLANFTIFGATAGVSHRLLTVVPLIALGYYLYARLGALHERNDPRAWEPKVRRLYLYAPAVLAAVLLRFELGRTPVVLGWALLGLSLLLFGVRRDNRDLRYQSYVLAALTFARAWTTNFYTPESLSGALGRLVVGTIVVACLYASQLLSARYREPEDSADAGPLRWLHLFDAHARTAFSMLGTVLLTVLIFHEVSGAWLTVAWGLEGVALLIAGFALRERSLRLSGLALLAICILKLFAYDLRELETLYRILSFAVLGFLLLCVSWTYTRFQEQLRRYL